MKKVMLGLVMVVMLMSLVGCGETKTLEDKEGFVPEQVTESEVVTNEVVEEELISDDLTKYYDTEKFLGTPRLVKMQSIPHADTSTVDLMECSEDLTTKCNCTVEMVGTIDDWKGQMGWKIVDCIVCDNNTPQDYSDDVVAYIFID